MGFIPQYVREKVEREVEMVGTPYLRRLDGECGSSAPEEDRNMGPWIGIPTSNIKSISMKYKNLGNSDTAGSICLCVRILESRNRFKHRANTVGF